MFFCSFLDTDNRQDPYWQKWLEWCESHGVVVDKQAAATPLSDAPCALVGVGQLELQRSPCIEKGGTWLKDVARPCYIITTFHSFTFSGRVVPGSQRVSGSCRQWSWPDRWPQAWHAVLRAAKTSACKRVKGLLHHLFEFEQARDP